MEQQIIEFSDDTNKANPGAVVGMGLTFVAIHSFFASREVKDWVRQIIGARNRNGIYRFAYIVKSLVMVAWMIARFLTLPDRELYRVKPPFSWLMRLGQVGSAAFLLWSIVEIGFWETVGLTEFKIWLDGKTPKAEPEAQGPARATLDRMKVTGPFRIMRHPGDLATIGVFLLFPRMTVNLATAAILATIYSVIGAVHEEQRLLKAYGDAYERYQRQVPFMLPYLEKPILRALRRSAHHVDQHPGDHTPQDVRHEHDHVAAERLVGGRR